MGAPTKIYVFGDQAIRVEDQLLDLWHVKDCSSLTAFLREATAAIQKAISELPATERGAFPTVETLGLLLDDIKKGSYHIALDSALVCIYEIGYYIRYLQHTNSTHPPPASCFVGLCTGSIAAAAISCSLNLSDIVHLGRIAVTVAFHVGMQAHRKTVMLTGEHAQISSWSVLVSGMTAKEATEAITESYRETHLSPFSRPYISAIGHSAITLSGRPDDLKSILSHPSMATKRSLSIPIHAPYHASHLYSQHELERMIPTEPDTTGLLARRQVIPMISSASVHSEFTSFDSLLHNVVAEILLQPIRLDRIFDRLSELTPGPIDSAVRVIPVNTHVGKGLTDYLTQKGRHNCHCEDTPRPQTWLQGQESRRQDHVDDPDSSKIAIIGFSGRFPEADGLDEFWDLLSKGLDVHKPIPPDRFDREAHYDPTGARKNTSKVLNGCWIEEPGLFDARFFHMSPKEACQADPAQRLALLTAYEALEMAGFVADRTLSSQRHRVGVFYGTTSDDWREVNSGQDIGTYFIPGGNRAFIPGRINYFFKFSGPSVSVDTACSSSLAAIDIACTSLLRHKCDTAIAGGTNIMTNPDNFAGLDRGHFLSHTGNCKTFDESADGYCRADGVGSVVLKRLSDAITDNDPIYGVVLGSYTNHSAEAVSITRPLADAQEYLFRRLLNESHISPHDISYIEMHGTGTQAGDAVEMRSVLNTFAWDQSRRSPLYLGSVKANVGHGESASGVTALIKVLLMMRKSRIPPHSGIKGQINGGFPTDLDKRQVHIALKEADWRRPEGGKRRTFVNNFSAAGGNTALLLEDAPKIADSQQPDGRSHHVVVLSARSGESLQRNLRALADFVTANPLPDLLPRLAYTTTARRLHHSRRVAIVASDIAQFHGLLLSNAESASNIPAVPAKTPAMGFLFTGQGAQQTAMGRGLYENFSSFRDEINNMDYIAQRQGFPSVVPLVDGTVQIDDLSPTVIQLGTCIVQIALAGFWKNLGLKPMYVLGHSLGEYAALHVAGVLSIADTIYLTGYRATLLEKRCAQNTHGMVAVKGAVSELKSVLTNGLLEVACINGSNETVLSGESDALDQVCEQLSEQGRKFTRLNVPYAFHSAQVDPILEELEQASRHVQFHQPVIPVVSPLLAAVIAENDSVEAIGPEYIRRHCRETVDFLGAVEAAQKRGLMMVGSVGIEIGAHPILSRMVKSMLGQSFGFYPSLRRNEDVFKTLSETLAALHLSGLPINWNEYHRDFPASQTVLELPRYSWDLANYWIQYEGNWCLTRGDAPHAGAPELPAAAQKVTRLSPSVQKIVEEKVNTESALVVAEADLQDEELLPVCRDHRVNGLILCPSSLYADIAYTLASYLVDTHKPEWAPESLYPDICNMAVEKALVVQPEGPQLFRAEMDLQWSTRHGSMQIYSVDTSGQRGMLHAKCNVVLGRSEAWREEWQRQLYLIRRSMDQLCKGVDLGSTHKIRRSLAYKLFSSVVEYGPRYQGLDEVVFDSDGLEATATVRLQPVAEKYGLNPFWCDSIGHLTGFVMNSNASPELTEYAFINHGWRSMRTTEKLSSDEVYQTYVKMQPVPDADSLFAGDVYLLRNSTIIAVFGSVTFQKVSRRVLEMLLPSPKKGGMPKRVVQATPAPVNKASIAATRKMDEEPSKFQKVVKVITSEIGVSPDQLPEDASFADFGVDSLMSLTIIGSLREATGLDAPPSLLEDYPSLSALREYLGLGKGSTAETSDGEDGSSSGSIDTGATTPPTADEQEKGAAVDESHAIVDFLFAIIADEIGVSTKDLLKSQNLSELGLDSLLSLTVLGRSREELDLDLPADFFLEHTTISMVKSALEKMLGLPLATMEAPPQKAAMHPPATSILLQGNDRCTKTLFLFPDGSGSATSYTMMPTISPDVRVYGLNCPYIKKPQDLTCALQDLTSSYVAEIRHRQPRGPYNLSGWSAGGIAAYDAAQYLVQQGETVNRLILLDSPNPISLEKLPPRFYHFLESAGVFGSAGGKKAPEWLIQHFLAFIDALDRYKPVPFVPARAVPRTTIIWAKDGVCKNAEIARPKPQAGDTKEMMWLMNNREDLGFNGWDRLLGKQNITIEALEEVNHFSMVRMPGAAGLAELIRKALDCSMV